MKVHKYSNRLRLVRLLTLFSFFHFSGLNNGFTQVIVVAGKIQGANFAPALICKIGKAAGTVSWKNYFTADQWQEAFFKSSKVIEFASRSAVEKMLIESNLFQVWMNETFKKAANSGSEISGKKQTVESSQTAIQSSKSLLICRFTASVQEIYERRISYLKLWEKCLKWNERWKLKTDRHAFWARNYKLFLEKVNGGIDLKKKIRETCSTGWLSEKFKGVAFHQSGSKGEENMFLSIYKEEDLQKIYPVHDQNDGVIFLSGATSFDKGR